MKPLSNVTCEWSADFAYVIGLLVTDGNLSLDGRHINFTSKDIQLVTAVKNILGLKNTIGKKARIVGGEKKYFVLQFGDVNFYTFLLDIGLTPNKSKTINHIDVPKKYFFDFLRGCIDGDGNIISFTHPESQHKQLRVRLFSASKHFLSWIQDELDKYGIHSRIRYHTRVHVLVCAMQDSKKLLHKIYYRGFTYGLLRKYNKARPFMLEWRNW